MNQNIPQLATIKISCNEEVGTAVIYFPDPDVDYVYILTAKHCLAGKDFDKTFVNSDIVLEKIFNEEKSDYYHYYLTEQDIVNTSDDKEDMALLILSKNKVLPLTGKQFFCQVTDTDLSVQDYEARGFANFNEQEADRSFPLKFREDQKDDGNKFLLQSENSLDSYYQQALENVEGLSGSGAYSQLFGSTYFTGIIQSYENNGIFLAAKVLAYNSLIPSNYIFLQAAKPETNQDILSSYTKIERNEDSVNKRTREKIGNFNVPRDKNELLKAAKNNSVVVVHGNPGVGKSAITKSVVKDVKSSGEYTILTFTTENLYCDTLSEALANAGCKANIHQLMSSPLSSKYFMIWIESFEKLIESDYSGAFNELLELIAENTKITVILTIRDYLLQKFKINYQFELPQNIAYFQINEFNDDEIELIRTQFPELNTLLDNPKIDYLLRNPYYLDKAVRIIPELLKEEHLDELQFKRLMWKHIVEKNNVRRGSVFYDICLKRSSEMSLFTTYDIEPEITADLVRDNILQGDNFGDGNTFSPSHDILEDWALVRFIRQQKSEMPNAKAFLLSIKADPAMKRAFRLWLEEFYMQEPEDSVSFVHQLLNDDKLEQSWKDDLLIVSLRSNHSKILLESFKSQFLTDSGVLLKKIITLLRTGCKKIDPLKRDLNHLIPVGTGWDYVIDFIKDNFSEIKKNENFRALYLNLILEWSKQLPDFNQKLLPPAAKSAAFLLEDFIYQLQTRSSEPELDSSGSSFLNSYIAILFKLTSADPELIEVLIDAVQKPKIGNQRWTNIGILVTVRNFIVDGVNSDQICRFFPDAVFQMAQENWAKKEETHRSGRLSGMINQRPNFNDFGLDRHLNHHYRNPSGYHTFFYWMFLYHPKRALDFIMTFLNTGFEINQEILNKIGQHIVNVDVIFEDGSERQYYGNYDYWTMFRGARVYNNVVSSLLMGLERSLLDLVDNNNLKTTQEYIQEIIKESNNAAMLGVVASVLQSNPDLLDNISVSLLGVPLFFTWESSRYSMDCIKKDVYNEDPFERNERITANFRSHRTKYPLGLIGFVTDYIFYRRNLNTLLFKQIDHLWKIVSNESVMFRKFLFDMDVRTYVFKPIEQPGYENYVQFVPEYDAEINEILNIHDEYPTVSALWAKEAFDKKESPNHNYKTWKIGYEFILQLDGEHHVMVAPGTMASLALRDFSDQLEPEELAWCRKIIINSAKSKLEDSDPYHINLDVLDSQPLLFGLSYLFTAPLDPVLELQVKELIFRLLLAKLESSERKPLHGGIAQDLSITQPQFALNCWFGLLEFTRCEREQNAEYQNKTELYHRGELSRDELENFDNIWVEELIVSVVNGTISAPDQISVSLDKQTYWLLDDALRIISWKTELPVQHQFIQDFADVQLNFIRNPHLRKYSDYSDSREDFKFFYARFLLSQPVAVSVPLFKNLIDSLLDFNEEHTSLQFVQFVCKILEQFIYAVNTGFSEENFWVLWECLRVWTVENKRLIYMSLFLMDIQWHSSAEHWSVLEGKNLYYKDFIIEWGGNLINVTLKFLNGIAFRNFMPDSITWIAILLCSENSKDIDSELLDKFAEKAFYKYGGNIKRNQDILLCFLYILEILIAKGSPKAYMLKDELVQYKIRVS